MLIPLPAEAAAMEERGWRDLIVGNRMRVDQDFSRVVESSGFSRSEWGMIMTAVDFEVEGGGDSARLVADTSKIDLILPEVEKVAERMGGSQGASSGSGLSGLLGNGLAKSIRSSLGLGGVDPERRDEAVRLVNEYADLLQANLEERDRWEEIRDLAIEQDRSSAE